MNKISTVITAIAVVLSTSAFAADESIMFELGFGFGTSSKVTKTEKQLANPFNNRFCAHRPSGTPIYGAIRYRYDDVEAHVGGWLVNTDATRCDRDTIAVGIGYVFDTQDHSGEESLDDYYATYTPGIAYTWGHNKSYNTQDNTHTNWRSRDNFQFYNRIAVGGGDEDYLGEIAIVRYGNPIENYARTGETFLTFSVGARDYDATATDAGDRSLTPPVIIEESDEFSIVIEDNTTSAPPSKEVETHQPPEPATNQFQFPQPLD